MSPSLSPLKYPSVRRDEQISESLHGQTISDPYRWLEDPASEETKQFISQQNDLTRSVYDSHIPSLNKVQSRMTELYNYEKFSCPYIIGNDSRKDQQYYIYSKNDGLQNQAVWYIQKSLDSPSRVIIDPNQISKDGTCAISQIACSEGKNQDNSQLYMAYGTCIGGSDWQTIHVVDVLKCLRETSLIECQDQMSYHLKDRVDWVKFGSISWTHDDKGFFYSRFPPTHDADTESSMEKGTETNANLNHQIWYHRIQTSQKEDVLVYSYPANPMYTLSTRVSDDGAYLLIYLYDGCKNANNVHITSISAFKSWLSDRSSSQYLPMTKCIDSMEHSFAYVTNDKDVFYFNTNWNAPRQRIVRARIVLSTDQQSIADTEWESIVEEPANRAVLEHVQVVRKDLLLVVLLENVHHVVKIYDLDGEFHSTLDLPALGTVSISGNRSQSQCFYKFTSFLYPGSIYQLDLDTIDIRSNSRVQGKLFKETNLKGIDPTAYCVSQVFYPSKDGTEIPMFLIHSTSSSPNGDIPTYLYGYGGFNISLTPSFSVSRLVFLQNFQGMIAIPNLRGGGEFGEDWHQSGMLRKKQTVFDDFQAAAEYLIAQNYTTPRKIAIHGGSNGGLLVAACANQRPDLFKCVVGAVGVMDMLRFHKFTIGHAWRSEYGDPEDPIMFPYLLGYSPLHTVPKYKNGESQEYPAVLLTTGDHDDRVVPLHSYKLISELQYQLGHASKNPLLIRIDTKSGHGAGKPTGKIIEESAQVFAFIAWCLDAEFVDL